MHKTAAVPRGSGVCSQMYKHTCGICMTAACAQGLFAATSDGLGRKLTGKLPSSVLYFANLIYLAAVLINLLGNLWYWTARREGLGTSTVWLSSIGEPGSHEQQYMICRLLRPLIFIGCSKAHCMQSQP